MRYTFLTIKITTKNIPLGYEDLRKVYEAPNLVIAVVFIALISAIDL